MGSGSALEIVMLVSSAVGLVCFLICLVRMFQNRDTLFAVLSILLFSPLALIRAWQKREEWNLQIVALVWTLALLIQLIVGFSLFATAAGHAPVVPR